MKSTILDSKEPQFLLLLVIIFVILFSVPLFSGYLRSSKETTLQKKSVQQLNIAHINQWHEYVNTDYRYSFEYPEAHLSTSNAGKIQSVSITGNNGIFVFGVEVEPVSQASVPNKHYIFSYSSETGIKILDEVKKGNSYLITSTDKRRTTILGTLNNNGRVYNFIYVYPKIYKEGPQLFEKILATFRFQ